MKVAALFVWNAGELKFELRTVYASWRKAEAAAAKYDGKAYVQCVEFVSPELDALLADRRDKQSPAGSFFLRMLCALRARLFSS